MPSTLPVHYSQPWLKAMSLEMALRTTVLSGIVAAVAVFGVGGLHLEALLGRALPGHGVDIE